MLHSISTQGRPKLILFRVSYACRMMMIMKGKNVHADLNQGEQKEEPNTVKSYIPS